MTNVKIEALIKGLGKNYDTLVAEGKISNKIPTGMFEDDDELYLDVAPGITLTFWAETKIFERLFITLVGTVPSASVYKGALPTPYALSMNQAAVRELFGKPLEASGPVKMPAPVGQTGGWEYYSLDPEAHPNTRVQFQYLESMDVDTIVFTLIDKGHD